MSNLLGGIGKIMQTVAEKYEPLRRLAKVVAGKSITVVGAIALASVSNAPIVAADAFLANVLGSWIMRLYYSQEAFAYHGVSAHGNYAIAGALAVVSIITPSVLAKLFLDDATFQSFRTAHAIIATLPYSAGMGALAAVLGTALGFHMQTVAGRLLLSLLRG